MALSAKTQFRLAVLAGVLTLLFIGYYVGYNAGTADQLIRCTANK